MYTITNDDSVHIQIHIITYTMYNTKSIMTYIILIYNLYVHNIMLINIPK